MPATENSTDDPNDAHTNQSTSEHSPTDPTPLDDPVTIDVTPVPFLRPGTVTAGERRLTRGDGSENVYTTSRPTAPIDEPPVARHHERQPSRLDDRQIATLRERIADRVRAWELARAAHGCECPRCGGHLQ